METNEKPIANRQKSKSAPEQKRNIYGFLKWTALEESHMHFKFKEIARRPLVALMRSAVPHAQLMKLKYQPPSSAELQRTRCKRAQKKKAYSNIKQPTQTTIVPFFAR